MSCCERSGTLDEPRLEKGQFVPMPMFSIGFLKVVLIVGLGTEDCYFHSSAPFLSDDRHFLPQAYLQKPRVYTALFGPVPPGRSTDR
jgi:hypothetical protein